jgi:hypothetical protein
MGDFMGERLAGLVAGQPLVHGNLTPVGRIQSIGSSGIAPDDSNALAGNVPLEIPIQACASF